MTSPAMIFIPNLLVVNPRSFRLMTGSAVVKFLAVKRRNIFSQVPLMIEAKCVRIFQVGCAHLKLGMILRKSVEHFRIALFRPWSFKEGSADGRPIIKR